MESLGFGVRLTCAGISAMLSSNSKTRGNCLTSFYFISYHLFYLFDGDYRVDQAMKDQKWVKSLFPNSAFLFVSERRRVRKEEATLRTQGWGTAT